VHPLTTDAVTYLSGRTESLAALFYLLTFYASIRAVRRGRRWEFLAVVACGLGMACGPTVATAPLIVPVFDRIFVFDSFSEALGRRRRLYLWLASTWLVLIAMAVIWPAGDAAPEVAASTYLLNQAVMIVRYLRLALWPWPLVIDYGPPWPVALSDIWWRALIVLGLAALTVAALRRYPRLGFLGLWFFLTLAPTSSVFPDSTHAGAEHRMYLPLISLITLAVLAGVQALRYAGTGSGGTERPADRGRAVAVWVLVLVCVALAARTLLRNREYRSSLLLAERTLERWPTPAAHARLGTELAAVGRLEEAEAHLRTAAPAYLPAKIQLAEVLSRRGNPAEATTELRQFVREAPASHPRLHAARGALAELYMRDHQWGAAAEQYRTMLARRPEDYSARRSLASALAQQGAFYEAIDLYRSVLADRPNDVDALAGLGVALLATGRLDQAITALRRAVDIDPGNDFARQNLARALRTPRK
jgi:tetratricopeptide (TPR) repeat protein